MDMSTTLTLKEFETLLSKIDAGLRGLPATAQVIGDPLHADVL